MGKIIINDMQIMVRKESDRSRGWVKASELVDIVIEEICKEMAK